MDSSFLEKYKTAGKLEKYEEGLEPLDRAISLKVCDTHMVKKAVVREDRC